MAIQGPLQVIIILPAFTVTFLWGLVSVMFSPFAAGICMWLARRRGLNVWYYGLIGAIYSISFLYPWVYLATRLLGRRMSPIIVIAGYVNMYVWWLASLFGVFLFANMNSGEFVALLSFVHLSIGAIAAVGSALALIVRNRNHSEKLGQNVQPLLGEYSPISRKLIAGYVVFCVMWAILLFSVYVVHNWLLYPPLVLASPVLIAIPAIFAVVSAWTLIRNRNRHEKLGQNVQPFLGGHTPSSSDLIYIAPFTLAFAYVSVLFGVVILL